MTYPGIGGTLATNHGYTCKDCGQQIISSIPTERCEPCHLESRCITCGQRTTNPTRICNTCVRIA